MDRSTRAGGRLPVIRRNIRHSGGMLIVDSPCKFPPPLDKDSRPMLYMGLNTFSKHNTVILGPKLCIYLKNITSMQASVRPQSESLSQASWPRGKWMEASSVTCPSSTRVPFFCCPWDKLCNSNNSNEVLCPNILRITFKYFWSDLEVFSGTFFVLSPLFTAGTHYDTIFYAPSHLLRSLHKWSLI